MKRYVLIIFLATSSLACAQVPGYQGKRFLLSYNLGVSSNLFQIMFTGANGPVQPKFGIFTNHSLDAEYVLDRRFSLEGEFSFLHNKINYTDIPVPLDVITTSFGVNCVFYPFKDNALAPVGAFTKLKLYSKNITASGPATDDYGRYLYSSNPKGQAFGIGLAFGHHHIIKNKILLTGSLDMDFDVGSLAKENRTDDVLVKAEGHLLSTYLVYLKFGIGGLLF
jgi:hypothetical protein